MSTTLTRPTPPPVARGQLWYHDEIPAQFFKGKVSARWVLATFPKSKGIKIGRRWAWYEAEILAHIEHCRGGRLSA